MLGGGLSPSLGRAIIAVPRARECTEVLRLARGANGTGVTIGKDRQLLLRRANGRQQRHRVERGELFPKMPFDSRVDPIGGEQPLIRSQRWMIAFAH
jgi:hypothetical protein